MMSEAETKSSGLIPFNEHNVDNSERSSSTEGPDSPGQSSSTSPLPLTDPSSSMMIPPSPTHGGSDGDAQYSVRFTDHITKDGDSIYYRMNVRKLIGGDPNEIITIDRQYDDFDFLHHLLTTSNRIDGIIIPPLPPRPASDPLAAQAKAKKQLGSSARTIRGDDFIRDCRLLEKYINMMINHPIIGKDKNLSHFLEKSEPPLRSKIKKGFLAGVMSSFDSRKAGSVKDLDDSFQKERDWVTNYGNQIKSTCDKFHNMIYSRLRLVNNINQLATILNASVGGHEGPNAFYNRFNGRFSNCLMEEKTNLESTISNEDRTLSTYLELYSSYLESTNNMLLRRTSLMVEYDNASKALAKAKINKVEAAKVTKENAEKQYNDCSELARKEIKRFHQRRLVEMKEALIFYVEGQIKCAKEASGGLRKAVKLLEDFPLPEPHPERILESEVSFTPTSS